MLGVGEKFPTYSLSAVVSLEKGKEFTTITNESYEGKWKVYFFWPKDFTFVCPTEIAGFGKHDKEFKDRDAQLLGGSIDSEWVHLAWRTHHADLCPSQCWPTSSATLPASLEFLTPPPVWHSALLTSSIPKA